MTVGRLFSTAAGSIAALLLAATALAQQPADTVQPGDADDVDAPGRGRPVPRDDRSGTVSGFAGAALVVPAGGLGGGLTFAQVAAPGMGGEVGVAVGLTRYSALELRGQFAKLGAACATCSAQMFSAGLGLVYHTSQALGFDPWVRFGAAYRALLIGGELASLVSTASSAGTFHGVDVASLALGGDYYPIRWLGVGLFLQGDVGLVAAAPPGVTEAGATTQVGRGAVYGLFQVGLRIALAPQQKAVTAAQVPQRRTAIVERWDFAPALYNRGAR
jgi:hypothetical protein